MKLSGPRLFAVLAVLFVGSAVGGLLWKRNAVAQQQAAAQHEAVAASAGGAVGEDDWSRPSAELFAQTADRVTIGSGIEPERPAGPLTDYDQLFRLMAAMPDGEQKVHLAQQIGEIRDPAAAPVLLDWTITTTDRALLRSLLDALGPIADASLIADIVKRFNAAYRHDDKYRLGKVIRNITNPEAVPALIELANDPAAPQTLSVAATEALATVGTPPAVSVLFGKIEAAAPDETGRLMTAIARIDRAEALPSLQYAAVGNKDASTDLARVAAIQALANFRDHDTRELLQRLSTDPSGDVSNAARDVLARNK
jgi:hypothetical protein